MIVKHLIRLKLNDTVYAKLYANQLSDTESLHQ